MGIQKWSGAKKQWFDQFSEMRFLTDFCQFFNFGPVKRAHNQKFSQIPKYCLENSFKILQLGQKWRSKCYLGPKKKGWPIFEKLFFTGLSYILTWCCLKWPEIKKLANFLNNIGITRKMEQLGQNGYPKLILEPNREGLPDFVIEINESPEMYASYHWNDILFYFNYER